MIRSGPATKNNKFRLLLDHCTHHNSIIKSPIVWKFMEIRAGRQRGTSEGLQAVVLALASGESFHGEGGIPQPRHVHCVRVKPPAVHALRPAPPSVLIRVGRVICTRCILNTRVLYIKMRSSARPWNESKPVAALASSKHIQSYISYYAQKPATAHALIPGAVMKAFLLPPESAEPCRAVLPCGA